MSRWLLIWVVHVSLCSASLVKLRGETTGSEFLELDSFPAEEAHQGVAVDQRHCYAIANRAVGKYVKQSGELVRRWQAPPDSPLKHLNSGVVVDGRLYAAHSNWPATRLENSVEMWDVSQLRHLGRQALDRTDAALTWIDRRDGHWWGTFAHYGAREAVARTVLVQFDPSWQAKRSWTYPRQVVDRFLPHSCSGGAWGADGRLYVTGHDRPEIYVLELPTAGTRLKLVDILPAPIAGQAICWDPNQRQILYGIRRKSKQIVVCQLTRNAPEDLSAWLSPQAWQRDTAGPLLSLGPPGCFDDTHIFAPCVAWEHEKYWLWYCGSTGAVAQRVFDLGLATSSNGTEFQRVSPTPVFSYGDQKHSILTATLLRDEQGHVLRESDQLRLWFSATHFAGGTGLHTLHEASSRDGIHWSAPSPPQLENVYAPTILKDTKHYRMWYIDVSATPWVVRHAASHDGRHWRVRPQPVLLIDQDWEASRLFYPTVLKDDGVYLMWYGSYWNQHPRKTALGFAVSRDGFRWHKHPHNPVLRPDPDRPWESHYTTSQSVIHLPDGSWRIWYASRKAPPFVNKYFAINTAHWAGPTRRQEAIRPDSR